ncbi:conserved hypothetical protein [Hyphomicrobiales bacterium]|nr:conserved hypothetical protein [Hyphomicrobiales bacterium]CAH1670310.1 conserved hypothetical protein [Hyphomicrobiales bacterium]
MHRGVLAAIQHCPGRRRAIEELALQSESFRLLCGDLADAEAALRNWENTDVPLKEERCAEYRSLVAGLAAEISEIMDARYPREHR